MNSIVQRWIKRVHRQQEIEPPFFSHDPPEVVPGRPGIGDLDVVVLLKRCDALADDFHLLDEEAKRSSHEPDERVQQYTHHQVNVLQVTWDVQKKNMFFCWFLRLWHSQESKSNFKLKGTVLYRNYNSLLKSSSQWCGISPRQTSELSLTCSYGRRKNSANSWHRSVCRSWCCHTLLCSGCGWMTEPGQLRVFSGAIWKQNTYQEAIWWLWQARRGQRCCWWGKPRPRCKWASVSSSRWWPCWPRRWTRWSNVGSASLQQENVDVNETGANPGFSRGTQPQDTKWSAPATGN